ncbi:hypothetical protein ACFSVJ_12060 [Prauserella oleivorans]
MGEFGYDPYDPLRYQERKARQEFSDAELAEMRRLLDDPSISAQNKQNMLYALSNANKVSDEEIDKYAREVGADAEDVRRGGESLDENLEHARQSLTEAPQEQWQAGARENQRKVQSAQQALGAGGFSSSDEIIDQAEVALKLFDDFHPRYQKASGLGLAGAAPTTPSEPQVATAQLSTSDTGAPAGATAAYTHSGGDPQSIRNGLDEFRGIAFTAFRTDAEMLNTAHATVSESTEALNSAWSSGTADWTGDAKSAAEQTNNGLVKGAGDLSQALRTAPGNITATVDAIEQNVTKFAEAVLQVYGDGTVAGLTPQQVDAFIKAKEQLPGAIQELEAKIQELENQSWWDRLTNFDDMFLHPLTVAMTIVSPIGSLVGYEFAKVITVDNIREETEKMKGALQEAEQKLAEFIADYDNKANTVHQQGSTYVSGIQENYTALIDALNQSLDPDPFAAGDKGGDTKPSDVGAGPAPAPGGTGGVPGGGTGGAPGGGTGGVPGAGGGTGGAPGAGGMPEMKPPELEGEAGTGTNPVTGKPLEVDPETGKPYPIDPETGEPVKDAGGDRDTLTVEKGEHTLELEEPDDQGKMAISVDDGSGEAKDYKLDFGTGVEDLRGDEGFGPQGSEPGGEPGTGAEPGAGDEQVYRPGPDGKIHIEDGNLKITASSRTARTGRPRSRSTTATRRPPPTRWVRRGARPRPQALEVARSATGSARCRRRARTRSPTVVRPVAEPVARRCPVPARSAVRWTSTEEKAQGSRTAPLLARPRPLGPSAVRWASVVETAWWSRARPAAVPRRPRGPSRVVPTPRRTPSRRRLRRLSVAPAVAAASSMPPSRSSAAPVRAKRSAEASRRARTRTPFPPGPVSARHPAAWATPHRPRAAAPAWPPARAAWA